ncbi:MAG: tail fiber domain-containing protein [Candidatus Marinimicrobia bacterium]|nr:tail fiber domain-containing protein [Candidatus Neomarinimicrobiota bacterium]
MKGKLFLGVLIIAALTAQISLAQLKIITNGNVGIGTENILLPAKLHIKNNYAGYGSFGIYACGIGYNAYYNYGIYTNAIYGNSAYGIYATARYASNKNYAGYFVGNVYVTGELIEGGSDFGIKEDVKVLDSVLPNVMKLKAKTFKYKKVKDINFAKGKRYGFIAQELEEVFPDLVVEHQHVVIDPEKKDEGEPEVVTYKVIKYSQLIPILVHAIQEQQQQIEELKKEMGK